MGRGGGEGVNEKFILGDEVQFVMGRGRELRGFTLFKRDLVIKDLRDFPNFFFRILRNQDRDRSKILAKKKGRGSSGSSGS